jgi:hypothetical protein
MTATIIQSHFRSAGTDCAGKQKQDWPAALAHV